MRASNLRTEHMVNPLGLQTATPTLSWNCTDGMTQTA